MNIMNILAVLGLVLWAAPAALAQSNRDVPSCALASEWVVEVQKLLLQK
jgi:hypothetical protein